MTTAETTNLTLEQYASRYIGPRPDQVAVISDQDPGALETQVKFIKGHFNGQHADPETGYTTTWYSFDTNAKDHLISNGTAIKKDCLIHMMEAAAEAQGIAVVLR